MEESAIKGLKVFGADAPKPRVLTTVSVEGYDTSLPKYLAELSLRKLFSSCGEILFCRVSRHYGRGILVKSVAFVRFEGGAPEEKALKLNGTDLGGWTLIVKPATWDLPSSVDPMSFATTAEEQRVRTKGIDTSLPKIDNQIALCKHFSSCGEVSQVIVICDSGLADIFIKGERCVEKALELNGCKMGNRTLSIALVVPGPPKRKGVTNSCGKMHPRFFIDPVTKKMKKPQTEWAREMLKRMEMKIERDKKEKKMEKLMKRTMKMKIKTVES
ncbi:PREDICTED: nucleolin 1-like isoform X1 [Camelina sativa]|uniref:Nucleolin 1-like isoform X1 n=1 Tax=Camelina sativa TaxID=90675 RepID=A0ABM0TB82_CAMSA|nr:PREDICTED: nucleolin 1-like isoform X1 [Camelina sativa]